MFRKSFTLSLLLFAVHLAAQPQVSHPLSKLVKFSILSGLQSSFFLGAAVPLPAMDVPEVFTDKGSLSFTSSLGITPRAPKYNHMYHLPQDRAEKDFMALEFGQPNDQERLHFFFPLSRDTQLPHKVRAVSSSPNAEDAPSSEEADWQDVLQPWKPHTRQNCKLTVTNSFGGKNECSGSMVERDLVLTARHCTVPDYSATHAVRVEVRCGFGYTRRGSREDLVMQNKEYEPHAHYGTALVESCVRYPEYDAGNLCQNDDSCGNRYDRGPYYDTQGFDIQVCKLDRALGDVVGWNQVTLEDLSELHFHGYPEYSKELRKIAGPQYKYKMYAHFIGVNETDFTSEARYYRIRKEHVASGESGSSFYQPQYHKQGELPAHQVGAVLQGDYYDHSVDAVRLRHDLAQVIDPSHRPQDWGEPRSYCQVIRLSHDIHEEFPAEEELRGICHLAALKSRGESCDYRTTTVVQPHDLLRMRLTLHNAGNLPTKVRLNWYLADESGPEYFVNKDMVKNQTLLRTDIIRMAAGGRNQIEPTVRANWPLDQNATQKHIVVWWKPLSKCDLQPTDSFWAYVGTVHSRAGEEASGTQRKKNLQAVIATHQALAGVLFTSGFAIAVLKWECGFVLPFLR
ncbi:MAG: hypothetical protein OXT67_03920 [Zetaproteobacteria bacterium]|nr:hypothetical protein [Zetaproteobacteria bacterium]